MGFWALSLPLCLVSRACEPWLFQGMNGPSSLAHPHAPRGWEVSGKEKEKEMSSHSLNLRFKLKDDTGILQGLLPGLEIPAWVFPGHPGLDVFPHCVHRDPLHSYLREERSSIFYRPGNRGKRREKSSLPQITKRVSLHWDLWTPGLVLLSSFLLPVPGHMGVDGAWDPEWPRCFRREAPDDVLAILPGFQRQPLEPGQLARGPLKISVLLFPHLQNAGGPSL